MGNELIRSITYGIDRYIKPYVNMGNSRGTFGSLKQQSFQISGRKKKSQEKKHKQGFGRTAESAQVGQDGSGKDQDIGLTAAADGSVKAVDRVRERGSRIQAGAVGQSGSRVHGEIAPIQTCSPAGLRQAILWSEILGDPVSKKRRRRRVSQQYGNQGNACRG